MNNNYLIAIVIIAVGIATCLATVVVANEATENEVESNIDKIINLNKAIKIASDKNESTNDLVLERNLLIEQTKCLINNLDTNYALEIIEKNNIEEWWVC